MGARQFRQSEIRRAMQAVESGGGFVRAVEIDPDGTVRILTGPRPDPLASNENDDWVAFAGTPEISRA